MVLFQQIHKIGWRASFKPIALYFIALESAQDAEWIINSD
jgi:hypothetical protein